MYIHLPLLFVLHLGRGLFFSLSLFVSLTELHFSLMKLRRGLLRGAARQLESETWSARVGAVHISIKQRCRKKKSREGSLSLAAAFMLTSRGELTRNMK